MNSAAVDPPRTTTGERVAVRWSDDGATMIGCRGGNGTIVDSHLRHRIIIGTPPATIAVGARTTSVTTAIVTTPRNHVVVVVVVTDPRSAAPGAAVVVRADPIVALDHTLLRKAVRVVPVMVVRDGDGRLTVS